ncbi:putative fatty acyl-CoA reductase CG5065 [Anabrus simplex]|uniref:putative fatty acyl-CoA reductase CG5065 n=1 Tax=Anabrus simplex TaxID=316456 RepID=UPI0035A38C84
MAEFDGQSVTEFFTGRHVFITGATGFLGSVLLEKLLRSCPKVNTVYVLVRGRKGKDAASRLMNLLQSPLFDRLKSEQGPDALRKVVGVTGDVSSPDLGLNEADRRLLSSTVSVVFHAAATTNFNSTLEAAVRTNLLGTKSVLNLCREMERLVALVYVSTAFCNCTVRDVISEQVYPSAWPPDHVVQAVQNEGEMAIRLVGGHPNTYSFTKQLAENVLQIERGQLPIAIVRPSIVLGAWEEPAPGWVDNVPNGAYGFLAGASKGVFRVAMADPSMPADVIPCDLVANLLIVSAWSVAKDKEPGLQVFHATSGQRNPISWGEYIRAAIHAVRAHPCQTVLWYPGAKCRVHPWRVFIAMMLLQIFPAFVLKGLSRKSGMLLPLQRRYWRGIQHVRYFTTRRWHFDLTCTNRLAERLSPEDRATFPFDAAEVHWPTCLERGALSMRVHFHNESPDTLPAARFNMAVWWWIHVIAHVCLLLLLSLMFAPLAGTSTGFIIASVITLFFVWL